MKMKWKLEVKIGKRKLETEMGIQNAPIGVASFPGSCVLHKSLHGNEATIGGAVPSSLTHE